ncbi:TatD family hydrolase [Facklamia miroungae]|uniref:TatD DNase family protein n=1 Tax=Facklamia miroungae TaxID=120956 RepID=A0A1G7RQ34_9LACT|nr:TatD family hydrolase [Facklamia miroungae]NKZ29322.1 TatD family hydrolase [Facklamia miroungae]SDG12832.1 TatD DNase family protein [Facklamia miroungae]
MKLFDTHTHLNVSQFQGKEREYLQKAKEAGVEYLAVVGFDRPTIDQSLALSHDCENIISVVGCHPTETIYYDQAFEDDLHAWLELDRVKMLGEIGLDYHWDTSPKDIQIKFFRRQIAIAKEHNLPITIHNREATEDCYRILKEEGVPEAGGIMHSFGEGPEEAKRFLDLGMHLSFSGVLTFKKTDQVRQAALITPLDKLLIETDAPYLAPVPMRGKQNEPAFVKYVAEQLAQLKKLSVDQIAQITSENAFALFKWRPKEEN